MDNVDGHGWSNLPILVLDKIFQHSFLQFSDLKNYALVCKQWSHATRKIPYVQNVYRAERVRLKAIRDNARRQRIQKRKDSFRSFLENFWIWLLMMLPAVLCGAIGLVGVLHFYELDNSISVIPDCPNRGAMLTSLYASAGFWMVDSLLFLVWSFSIFNDNSYSKKGFLHYYEVEDTLRVINTIGIVSNLGIWSSAAACVHFANHCSINPSISSPVHSWASVSLAFGLLCTVLGAWTEFMLL